MKLYLTSAASRKRRREYYKRNSKKILEQQSGRFKVVKETLEYKNWRWTYNADRKAKTRAWFNELKATLSCMLCPETASACLDFHHRDPSDKRYGIADMVSNAHSIKSILKEIEKCDVLCKNCHAKLHHEEKLQISSSVPASSPRRPRQQPYSRC